MTTNFFRKHIWMAPASLAMTALLLSPALLRAQADLTICEGRSFTLTICEGQDFCLTSSASGHPDLGPITYQWYEIINASSVTVGFNAPTLTVTGKALGSYAYLCEVSNAACTLLSSSFIVDVVAPPPVPTLTSSASSVCVGTAITFTASGGNGYYEWSGGFFSGTGQSITATPTVAGEHSVFVRSYVPAETVTCYSPYSSALTVTVVAGGEMYHFANECGCAEGTINTLSTYCMDPGLGVDRRDCSNTILYGDIGSEFWCRGTCHSRHYNTWCYEGTATRRCYCGRFENP
jgi:hypothetical protein